MNKKLYKVLSNNMNSPFRDFHYELNKLYTCANFDKGDYICSTGFYCTPLEGLVKWFRYLENHRVFEVEVGGCYKIFNIYDQRYETIKLIRELSYEELKSIAIDAEKTLKYKLSEGLFPFNPFANAKIHVNKVTAIDIKNMKTWIYKCNTVDDTIDTYMRNFKDPWEDINDHSKKYETSLYEKLSNLLIVVEDNIEKLNYDISSDAIRAYAGSLFPKIQNMKYRWPNTKGLEYPYQCLIDLWYRGFVPQYYNFEWRLYAGNPYIIDNIVYTYK